VAHRDFEEFIAALNARGVEYIVVGAHAVAFHAKPRATKDLDVFVKPTRANARKLLSSLADFFGAQLAYTTDDVLDPDIVLQLGIAPVRIDIMSELLGVERFADAWARRVKGRFGATPTSYLSLEDLIAAKTAADRPQDRADLAALKRARKQKL
jgi:hypothetical protein